MHLFTVNISQTMTDRANIAICNRVASGFQLADLNLTVTYSKGQLGCWNGVLQNILAFLLFEETLSNSLDYMINQDTDKCTGI